MDGTEEKRNMERSLYRLKEIAAGEENKRVHAEFAANIWRKAYKDEKEVTENA